MRYLAILIVFSACNTGVMHDDMIIYDKRESATQERRYRYYIKSTNKNHRFDSFSWYSNKNYNVGDTIK